MKKEKTLQVVIAHPIPAEQKRLTAIVEQDDLFHVSYVTHDGLDCLREVVSTQPDLVIVDAVLNHVDGLEVLRRLEEFPLSGTKRVFLTTYQNYLADYAALTNVDYCAIGPYSDQALAQRLRQIVLPPQEVISDETIDTYTQQFLQGIGAPKNMKGYYYTLEGMRILIRDPDMILRRSITKELYGGIAALHGLADGRCVERSMRTLTHRIFTKNDLDALSAYFDLADVLRNRISTASFFATIASYVTEKLKEDRKARQSSSGN